ncbi:MAG: hypothetical protein Q8P65_01260 [bacterium]|nr:hypothetical protein [bacterium]
MEILFFVFGLTLLLIGATGIINSSVLIGNKFRISPLIIGITAIAIGTSLPEITIAIFSSIDNTPDLALGNILGSNIVNIGLIFGISLFSGLNIGTYKTQTNSLISLLISISFFILLLFNYLGLIAGFFMLLIGFFLLKFQIKQGYIENLIKNKVINSKKTMPKSKQLILFLYFIISLLSLIFGGKLTVDYGIILASLLEIPQLVIGITVIAIGTSLPELTISIIGLIKKQEKLVIGNILGSNIFNILFGGGILGLYNFNSYSNNSITYTFFIFFSLFLSFLLYIFKGKRMNKFFGFVFIAIYIVYLYLLLT